MLKLKSHSLVPAAFLGALLITGCSSLSTKPPRGAGLSGDWQLDQALSEDPIGAMRQQRQSGGGGHSHHHHGGMGGMGGMGMPQGGGGMSRNGGFGGGGSHGSRGHAPVLPDFTAQPGKLSITQAPRELSLNADGVSTTLVYGEKVMTTVNGGTAERISGWKSGDFTVRYRVTDGPGATRTYEVGDGGKQLIVTTDVEGGPGPKFEFRTVYERASKS